jgi:hypothetical protein
VRGMAAAAPALAFSVLAAEGRPAADARGGMASNTGLELGGCAAARRVEAAARPLLGWPGGPSGATAAVEAGAPPAVAPRAGTCSGTRSAPGAPALSAPAGAPAGSIGWASAAGRRWEPESLPVKRKAEEAGAEQGGRPRWESQHLQQPLNRCQKDK